MKTSLKISLLIVTTLGSLVLAGCSQADQKDISNSYQPTETEKEAFEDHAKEEHGEGHVYVNAEELAAYDKGVLSEQEIADLIHMRQEEKLARDVYRVLGQTYSINQFKNIPLSEQKHTDAMELLLERYEIEDPIEDETLVGTYKDEKFIKLFNDLTQQGKESEKDALLVGATIEDINMAKLLEVKENSNNEDVRFVYESVLEQSHNHMNAFIRGLEKKGVTYTPAYISQEYFDSITGGEGVKSETYTPPSIESFYTTIEQMWLAEMPTAAELSQAERDQILKDVLRSHQSHLGGFDTQQMQDAAYSKVTEQVIRASK